MLRKALELLTTRIPQPGDGSSRLGQTSKAEQSNANVINLPGVDARGSTESRRHDNDVNVPVMTGMARWGLMSAPELESFFADNHFGLGRHNGAHYRNSEALALGKQGVTARFQNVLASLIERRKARIHRLQLEARAITGVSEVVTAQLQDACAHLQSEIDLLCHQFDLAADGKGWVLEALNKYHMGFNKGLQEVINFELLLSR